MRRSDAWQTEPVLHTFISDCLPDDDPRAWTSIKCVDCRGAVHRGLLVPEIEETA